MSVLWVILAAFALTIPLVQAARLVALRYGVVDNPRPSRVSRAPRPYLGGVAIMTAATLVCAFTWAISGEFNATTVAILLAVVVSGIIGLSDDLRHHTATPKLIAEFLVAGVVVMLGGTIAITVTPVVDALISLVVIVFLMNSFNLLDNSDGALSSVAAITGFGIAGVAVVLGQNPQGFLAAAVGGACLAFLLFNWHPATIFMGDAGSLFVGCALVCSLALIKGTDTPRSIPVALGLMIVPIVDTTLVFITRRREGRSFMAGGVDHLHHRLSRTTLGTRGGAAAIASVAATGSLTAIAVAEGWLAWTPAVFLISCIGLALLVVGLRLPSRATSAVREQVTPTSVAE